MEPLLVPLAAIFLLFVLPLIVIYNGLIRLRNHCHESWSDVDTELKRRYDLIPNLVATVKGYATHEAEVLERVTQLREQCRANTGTPEAQAFTENQLTSVLKTLMMRAEAYPGLKADAHFLELQRELANTEDRIQAARRFFNGNVRDLNNKVEMFPSNLVANLFGVRRWEFFRLDSPSEAAAPGVHIQS